MKLNIHRTILSLTRRAQGSPRRVLSPLVGGNVGDRGGGSVPFLLELAEVPDGQGDHPGEDEDADDDEPGGVDVEAREERPHGAVEVTVLAEQAEELDRA